MDIVTKEGKNKFFNYSNKLNKNFIKIEAQLSIYYSKI